MKIQKILIFQYFVWNLKYVSTIEPWECVARFAIGFLTHMFNKTFAYVFRKASIKRLIFFAFPMQNDSLQKGMVIPCHERLWTTILAVNAQIVTQNKCCPFTYA